MLIVSVGPGGFLTTLLQSPVPQGDRQSYIKINSLTSLGEEFVVKDIAVLLMFCKGTNLMASKICQKCVSMVIASVYEIIILKGAVSMM